MRVKAPRRGFVFLVGLAALAFAAAPGWSPAHAATTPVGGIAQDFTITNLATGQPLHLYDYPGTVIVLDFWTYWCPACQASAPSVETNIVQYYRNRGGNDHGVPVTVISISIDDSNPTAVAAFIQSYGVELAAADTGAAWGQFGTGFIPTFVVINGVAGASSAEQWEVLYSQVGYSLAGIRSAIDSVAPAAGNAFWSGATDLGGGWKWLDWFGYFDTSLSPWIYHAQHGYLYAYDNPGGGVVFWDTGMRQFWWTSSTAYPFIYRFGVQASWLWYLEDSAGPRQLYNFGPGSWESVP